MRLLTAPFSASLSSASLSAPMASAGGTSQAVVPKRQDTHDRFQLSTTGLQRQGVLTPEIINHLCRESERVAEGLIKNSLSAAKEMTIDERARLATKLNTQVSKLRQLDSASNDLSSFSLNYFNLDKHDFSGVIFRQTDLTGASINETRFDNCELWWTILKNVQAVGASFIGARLERTDFTNANLQEAEFTRGTSKSSSDLPNRITRVLFNGSDLRDALFENILLDSCDLTNANCQGARFIKSRLYYTEVGGAKFDKKMEGSKFFENNKLLNLPIFVRTRTVNLTVIEGGKKPK